MATKTRAGTSKTHKAPKAQEADDFRAMTTEDHIRTRDMWAGTSSPISTQMILFAMQRATKGDRASPMVLSAVDAAIDLSPALFKCFDEPMVNALDHAQRCESMTEIRVEYRSDHISIANNGAGIPVVIGEHSEGKLIPEFVFGTVFSGSNMKVDSNSTLGGINGIGVKITNIHSREFRVETYDSARGLSFDKTWTNGMQESTEAIVKKGPSATCKEGTRVSFVLDFEHFGTQAHDFLQVAFTRVIWAAFYLKQMISRVSVFWNGTKINFTIRQFIDAILSTHNSARIMSDIDNLGSAIIIAAPESKRIIMSVINGIVVPKGNHIEFVIKKIREATKAILAKQLRTNLEGVKDKIRLMTNKLAIIILWHTPCVHWNAQTKDTAQFEAANLVALTPSAAFIARQSEKIAGDILARLDAQPIAASSAERKKVAPIDKYFPARFAGTKKARDCRLFLAEGDSAKSQVCAGITSILSSDFYGVLSLNGVIMNVRKKKTSAASDKAIRSKRERDNKFINALEQIMRLDHTKKYDTEEERATLAYGGIIGCVDQDLDGVGNIFSLVLSLFHFYWPSLISAGFIQRLETPIIRAYPLTRVKSRVEVFEFYSNDEFLRWEREEERSKYKIRYYKGLGSHNSEEVKQMMRGIGEHTITYMIDDCADEEFEVYLGSHPEYRRDRLSLPPPRACDSEMMDFVSQARECCDDDDDDDDDDGDSKPHRKKMMATSFHLRIEAHAYQVDNLSRKLPKFMDGTNQVTCKILDGCFKVMTHTSEEKVEDLAGKIAPIENYHHGGDSMQDSITRRAFIAPGGNQLPMLLPQGQFGTRIEGGKDSAAPRYIFALFNHRINEIIYSSADYPLLSFHTDDGKRGEPTHFIPIIPMVILENVAIPTHGWKVEIWAREVIDVIENLRILIKTGGTVPPRKMRPCCFPSKAIRALPHMPEWQEDGSRVICDCAVRAKEDESNLWHGYIVERMRGGSVETWSLGTYVWEDKATIHIEELPLCVWTLPYVAQLEKIADSETSIISKWHYAPHDTKIDIHVTFAVNSPAFASSGIEICESGTRSPADIEDPIIRALFLRAKMNDLVNLMMPDNSVRTFDSYEDVLALWFDMRKGYFARRIQRQREIISMWILYFSNIIRFIKMEQASQQHHLAHMEEDEAAIKFLTANNFAKLVFSFLESPELKFEAEVAKRVLDPEKASYDYILNLRERDMHAQSLAKFEKHLREREEDLAQLNERARITISFPFEGAAIWLEELDKLEATIIEGRRTMWQFENFGRFSFSHAKSTRARSKK